MAVNGVTEVNAGYAPAQVARESAQTASELNKKNADNAMANSAAAVYEKSSDTEAAKTANHKVDYETIDRLKAEADERTAQLRGLVEKLLLKQGGTYDISKGLANIFRNLEVDEATRKQAQEDISEDGYWGVKQTSDRIVDFAKAMAGDDPEMAQKMYDAIKEGFKQAGEEWGEDLPDISQQTMKATYNKMDEWIKSLTKPAEEEPQVPKDNTVQTT